MVIVKEILKLIYYILDILIVLYSLYYILTGLFTFFGKNKKIRKYKAKHKLAVIIAARNEEKVIGNLIDSLKKQNYPKDLYEIFVVPNNCMDNTEAVALKHNAKILECTECVKSKGDVLKYAFNVMQREYEEYDAYIVFDADNIVHPNFLRRMNDTLCAGYKVAQGYRDSKNPADSWISCCYSLFYWIQNYFFNNARMNMGWSSSINGTGFMVSRDTIKKYGFNTVTLTEDIEFAAQCALNNEKIAFVNDALTYDEQPITFLESWKQRKRWSAGTMQCFKTYSKDLLNTAITKRVPQAFDMALFFLAPYFQILTAVIVLLALAYSIVGIELTANITKVAIDNKMLSVIVGYFLSICISIFTVVIEKRSVKKTFKGILTLSIFMLSWIPINILCLVKREHEWEPIAHHRIVEIESIVDVSKY